MGKGIDCAAALKRFLNYLGLDELRSEPIDETWRYIGHLVDTIQPAKCGNYFANARYASVKI